MVFVYLARDYASNSSQSGVTLVYVDRKSPEKIVGCGCPSGNFLYNSFRLTFSASSTSAAHAIPNCVSCTVSLELGDKDLLDIPTETPDTFGVWGLTFKDSKFRTSLILQLRFVIAYDLSVYLEIV
jgi:hypothetical protein